jgi:tRNA nucleotidyltransferase/poly(A) polymerase
MRLRSVERAIRGAAERAGTTAYLVGGAVRDSLLGLPVADVDVAVADGEERLARELAAAGLGTAFLLSPPGSPGPVWRVAKEGSVVDVARFERGGTLEEDLARRDFTVNAIAREAGTRKLIDPHGGEADLRAGRIRSISEANLASDPLRVLRAYRLAAVRGWKIVPATRESLVRHARRVGEAAPERIHDELARLFTGVAVRAIAWAVADGVLATLLGIRATAAVLRAARRLPPVLPQDAAPAAGRLAILFRAASVSDTKAVDALRRTKFSRAEIRETARRRRFLREAFSRRAPERILFPFRDVLPSFLRLAEGAAANPAESARVRALRRTALGVEPREAPIDGDDVRTWLGIPPGPELGRRLEAARYGWFVRRWRSREAIRRELGGGRV